MHSSPVSALSLFLPLSLTALLACGETSPLGTADDLDVSDTAEATVSSALDGEAGVGPSSRHALRLDCSATTSTQTPDRPPPSDGDRPPRTGDGARGDGGRGGGHHGRNGHGFAWAYDVDGSGELDDTERAALDADRLAGCEARVARLIATYDSDGDGALSDAELAVAQAAIDAEHEARRAEALATYDADGDGTLSADEREAMRAAEQAALLAQYDTDGSGDLSDEEKAVLAEAIRAAIRSGERPPHLRV